MGLAPRPLARPVGLLALGTLRAELALKSPSLFAPRREDWRGTDMCSRLARLFWEALDRADHAVMVSRCWLVDLIYGPEPPTPADEKREAEHARLREAFPGVDIEGTVAIADEGQPVQVTPTTPITAFDEAPPRSAASAHRPAP
jgi:hypothetical protein